MYLTKGEVAKLLVSVIDRMVEHLFYYEEDKEFFGPISEIDAAYKQGYLQGMTETISQIRKTPIPKVTIDEIYPHKHNSKWA